jgi:hypothetical protein
MIMLSKVDALKAINWNASYAHMQTARSKVLGPLGEKVAGNEEGVLEITDRSLRKRVSFETPALKSVLN